MYARASNSLLCQTTDIPAAVDAAQRDGGTDAARSHGGMDAALDGGGENAAVIGEVTAEIGEIGATAPTGLQHPTGDRAEALRGPKHLTEEADPRHQECVITVKKVDTDTKIATPWKRIWPKNVTSVRQKVKTIRIFNRHCSSQHP